MERFRKYHFVIDMDGKTNRLFFKFLCYMAKKYNWVEMSREQESFDSFLYRLSGNNLQAKQVNTITYIKR